VGGDSWRWDDSSRCEHIGNKRGGSPRGYGTVGVILLLAMGIGSRHSRGSLMARSLKQGHRH
jgi:hypothetical protein